VLVAQAVKAVVPLPGLTLQLLSPADKARERLSQEKHERERDEGGQLQNLANTRTLKICHVGPAWIRRASFSALLSEMS
jgi:hypothetical protein